MTLRKNIIYTKEFTVSLRGGRKKQGKKNLKIKSNFVMMRLREC